MTTLCSTLKVSALALALALPLTACGEDDTESVGDTFLPERSEDHLIDSVQPAEQPTTQRDLTPQATTGGEIPGYSPVDKNEGVAIEGVPEGEAVGATPPPRRVPAEPAIEPLPADE